MDLDRFRKMGTLWRRLEGAHDDIERMLEGIVDLAESTPGDWDDRLAYRVASALGAHPDDEPGTVTSGLAKIGEGVEGLARRVPGGQAVAGFAGVFRELMDSLADDEEATS